ncbi:transposase [Nitrospira sp. Kam-Ns4a]
MGLDLVARGCSPRDLEARGTDADGRSRLARPAGSESTEARWAEEEACATRARRAITPRSLLLEGLAERLRPGAARAAVLVAGAITEEGQKVRLHVAPGTQESPDCCRELWGTLKRRGRSTPVLVVTDGAPGLSRAVEECFPASRRQRGLAHRMRHLLAKRPDEIRAEGAAAARAAYLAPSVAWARAAREEGGTRVGHDYLPAVACFEEDCAACIAPRPHPPRHRRICRTTNLLERRVREERRRLDAAGTLSSERAGLTLMEAALIRGAARWRGVMLTEFAPRQLTQLRAPLQAAHATRHAPLTKAPRKD